MTSPTSPLIDVEELKTRLGSVTLLDVRWALGLEDGHGEYLSGHIPGAAFVDLETDLADPPGERGRHPLPEPERFAAAMRHAGVTQARPVVVYDDVAGTSAARGWWLLRYFGHADVRLLDGGWSEWVATGGGVEKGERPVDPGDFSAAPGGMAVVTSKDVLDIAGRGTLIDARAEGRFRGRFEPVDPVAGHIPGAVNVPTSQNLGADGRRFLPAAQLSSRYAFELDGPVAAYCGSGVTASHTVLALAVLGVDAALYPGSWSEWVIDPTRPVAKD